jgi:hypothetical protein
MKNVQIIGIDYNEVPADFPFSPTDTLSERWLDWGICEELAQHLHQECLQIKAAKHRSVRCVDILYQQYRSAQEFGWGTDPELRWVIRRTAVLLNWPAPDVVRRP